MMRKQKICCRINNQFYNLFLVLLLVVPSIIKASPITSNTAVNEAVYWNQIALGLIQKNNTPPPRASRMLGILHVAIFEVINATNPKYQKYLVDHVELRGQNAGTAAAQAAAYVLAVEYPDDVESINATLRSRDPNFAGVNAVRVAKYIVDQNPLVYGEMETPTPVTAFQWVKTAPNYAEFLLPKWCSLKPLGIRSAKTFRKAGPPEAGTEAFESALEETRLIGGIDSEKRTADQTEIALFWADGKGTVTPPGHWNQIATSLIQASHLSLLESARVLALLNIAMADAGIVAWDMKYMYQLARPITLFEKDGWKPLIATPPFPEYVSGHSTFSGAAATVLTDAFQESAFTTTSDGLPGVARKYNSFDAAAMEAGMSRIYGGIHFAFSDRDGRSAGANVANDVLNNHLLVLNQ